MPLESQRSLGYRFITCADPNGVVECGSIRRSRAKYQKMEAVVENPRKMKRPPQKDWELGRGQCSEGSGGSTVVQLSEVSRGAQDLNRMIETWSRGARFDGLSKDIMKDLPKGTLNLQESLILLGKLQEATKYAAQLKQKAEKSEEPQKDMKFQKPRISVDEALDRTNKFCRKEFNSICEAPSTSSSQSSKLNGDDAACYTESGAFSTAITQQGRASGSNVIAKLMGLEEIPRIDNRMNSRRKRPTFYTGVNKFSKPRFEVPRVGREPRSLKEIHKGIQSKGLLRSDLVGNWKSRNDNHPPIVLIKPFAAPVVEAKEQLVQEEKIFWTKVLLKNVKLKEEIFQKFSDGCQERVDMSKRFDVRNEVEEYESSGCRSKVSDRTKEGSHAKKQFSSPVSENSPKSDALGRKLGETQISGKNSRRYLEEASRSRMYFSDPRCRYNMELTNTKLVRPKYSGQNKMKNGTTTQQSRTQKDVPNQRMLEGRWKKSSDRNRSPKVKQITTTAEKDIGENEISVVECEKIEEKNNGARRIEVDSVATEASSSTVTSASVEETDQAAAILRLQEDGKNKQCDLDSEDYHIILLGGVHSPTFTNRSNEKALLRSDSAFLARVEDLFQSFGIHPTILRGVEKDQPRSVGDKLYLDCANEFIERKDVQVPHNLHSISFTSRGICPSLTSVEKLIDEVCEGINDLHGWCEFADGHLSADGFHALLKRDMWSKGFATRTWEFGWKEGFSGEDVEQVVSNMERMVLGWLIEEAIAEA